LSAATTLSSAAPTQIGSDAPAINFRIFWDGDLLSEVLDTNKITKWAYPGMPSGGFSSATLAGIYGARNAAPLYGDMFGDWREEVLLEQSDSASMRIYSTAIPTQKRIYTLVHDPEYRNSMCEKGYIQSHMLDYYLGDGMTDPPKPNIKYPDGSGAAGSGGGGTTGAAGAGGGAVATGGDMGGSAGTPETGGAAGGSLVTGGNVVASTGGIATATTAGAAGTVASTSAGAAGQSGTGPTHVAADAGCSCGIGTRSGRNSVGAFLVMLGMLGLVVHRRRQGASRRK
jgi:hypothetical protein